jgi:tetratricopeptide (TPR) repeat protein
MSSVKQEVAAILMDYTDKIPEQVYIDILNKLGEIPDHRDPKKASEIQLELDKANKTIYTLENENDIFRDENDDLVQSLADSDKNFYSLAKYFNRIVKNIPTVHNDSILLYDVSNMSKQEIVESIDSANRFIDNLDTVCRGQDRMRYTLNTGFSTNEGVGETDNILPSISNLFSTIDDADNELNQTFYNDSGEVIEKEDENIENFNEIDQDKEGVNNNSLNSRDEITLISVAEHLETLGNHEDAIKQYRDIIQFFPESYKTYYRLARIIDNTARFPADYDTAVGYYLTAISLNPEKNYSRCYNTIGIINEVNKKNYVGAEEAYRKAIEFDETHGHPCADVHFNLADLLQKCYRNEEAIAEYLIVLKETPKDIMARESIMKLLNIKFSSVKRRLIFTVEEEPANFEQLNTVVSEACYDCLVKKIINYFNGKINNYYGIMLIHEKNPFSEYTKSVNVKYSEKETKKIFTRDMRYSVFMKKEQEWKNTSNTFCREILAYQTLL